MAPNWVTVIQKPASICSVQHHVVQPCIGATLAHSLEYLDQPPLRGILLSGKQYTKSRPAIANGLGADEPTCAHTSLAISLYHPLNKCLEFDTLNQLHVWGGGGWL